MSNLKSQSRPNWGKKSMQKVSDWKFSQGFSLIELLVVFSIIGVVMVSSIASFYSYNKNQSYVTAVADVKQMLNLARSKAMSQVKPVQCGTSSLDGYQFWYPTSGTYYRLSVRCGGTYHVLERKSLPSNVTFTTSTTIFFKVSTGTIDAARNIVLTGDGKTSTIRVEKTGSISVL